MKKTYIAPTAKEININTQTILAGSTFDVNTEDNGLQQGDFSAKENNFFDEF